MWRVAWLRRYGICLKMRDPYIFSRHGTFRVIRRGRVDANWHKGHYPWDSTWRAAVEIHQTMRSRRFLTDGTERVMTDRYESTGSGDRTVRREHEHRRQVGTASGRNGFAWEGKRLVGYAQRLIACVGKLGHDDKSPDQLTMAGAKLSRCHYWKPATPAGSSWWSRTPSNAPPGR